MKGRERILDFKLALAMGVLLGSLLLGVIGFHFVEGTSWLDSVYIVVQIFSTVGLDKTREISPAGRLFIVVLISVFLTSFTFAGSVFFKRIVSTDLRGRLVRHWREKRATKMNHHYIVCGHGRLGRMTVDELQRAGRRVVVVEKDEEEARMLANRNIPVIVGDATEDSHLQRANISEADGLVATLSDDADNVFVTLTAHQMNPALRIIARANNEKTSSKLKQAGAHRVVRPYEMGGKRLAYALIQPVVADFIDRVTGESHNLRIGQWTIPADSDLVGKNVRQAKFRSRFGVSVLGIAHSGGPVDIVGTEDDILQAGDTLVVLGPDDSLHDLPH